MIDKASVKTCCGRSNTIFRIKRTVDINLIQFFVLKGFKESVKFTEAKVLYVESDYLVITGSFGSNKLQISCKKKTCENEIASIENDLNHMI
jgi:hypothetical protein